MHAVHRERETREALPSHKPPCGQQREGAGSLSTGYTGSRRTGHTQEPPAAAALLRRPPSPQTPSPLTTRWPRLGGTAGILPSFRPLARRAAGKGAPTCPRPLLRSRRPGRGLHCSLSESRQPPSKSSQALRAQEAAFESQGFCAVLLKHRGNPPGGGAFPDSQPVS